MGLPPSGEMKQVSDATRCKEGEKGKQAFRSITAILRGGAREVDTGGTITLEGRAEKTSGIADGSAKGASGEG